MRARMYNFAQLGCGGRGARGKHRKPRAGLPSLVTARRASIYTHCKHATFAPEHKSQERSAEGKRGSRRMCVVYSRSGFRKSRDIVISPPGSRARVSVCTLCCLVVKCVVVCACVREKRKNQLRWQVAILNGSHRVGYPRYFWQSQSVMVWRFFLRAHNGNGRH